MFQHLNRRRIFLLRHAEAAYISEDGVVTNDPDNVPLTELGRQQARKQAGVLASVPFDRAICSGLPRTVETANLILAGRPKPALEIIDELREIRGGGPNQSVDDVSAWLQHVANPWAGADEPDARFLGGERFADFADRVNPNFDAIVGQTDWSALLLVLHGGVNRMIFNHILGLPWQGRVSVEQDNCCINIIDVDCDKQGNATRYLVRAVNLTGYNLNKSDIVLTTMEQTAARISEELRKGSGNDSPETNS